MRRSAALPLAVLLLTTLSGCGSGPGEPPASAPAPTSTIDAGPVHGDGVPQPGPFIVRYDDTELRLRPYTACTNGGCVDGFDPSPPTIGAPAELLVAFADAGYEHLEVTQRSGDDECRARTIEASVTDVGNGWWRVSPAGPAGDYTISLFAHGTAGDAAADLRWTTPHTRPLPDVAATLSLIADHDGIPDSYGVELTVANLPETPREASAAITVTSAGGASHTITGTRITQCTGDGTLRFEAPASEGRAAAALGGFPFEYRVELTIDGEVHTGTGTFPDDAPPQGLGVPLMFSTTFD